MYIDPVLYHGRPSSPRGPQEEAIYDRLTCLGIPFRRADHDHADTIEFCQAVEQVLGSPICKNLFLCNRQQTEFYLLLMPGEKPFQTKYLSALLGCSRLSFAGAEAMARYLQTRPGSVSALELLFDPDGQVRLVLDQSLLTQPYLSAHPGVSTSTLQLAQEDFMRYVVSTGHPPTVIDLPWPSAKED